MPLPRRFHLLWLPTALLLSGCMMLPDFKSSVMTKDTTAPVILPLDGLLAQVQGATTGPETAVGLDARAAGLRARAAGLPATDQDAATRARLAAAIADTP